MTPKELTALKLKFYDAMIRDPELSAIALRVAWLLLSRYLNAQSLVAWPSAEMSAGEPACQHAMVPCHRSRAGQN